MNGLTNKLRAFRSWVGTLDAGNWIALAALLLSVFSVSWQIWKAWVGADLELLSLSQRVVEVRCHTTKKVVCWGSEDGAKPSTGRFTIVVPAFFVNEGASGYNAVVDRVTAEVSFSGRKGTTTLVANKLWQLVQSGGSQDSRPFVPFLVEGGKSNGAELHFVPFDEKNFVNWGEIAGQIADGSITAMIISVSAKIVGEADPLVETCRLEIPARLREVMSDRISRRSKQVRLTPVCA